MTRDPEEAARRAKQEMDRGRHPSPCTGPRAPITVADQRDHHCLQYGEDEGQAGLEQDKSGEARNMGKYGVTKPGKNLCVFRTWLMEVHEEEAWKIDCVRGAQLANSRKFVKKQPMQRTSDVEPWNNSKQNKVTPSVRRTRKINDG